MTHALSPAARRWSIRGWIPDTDWKCTSTLDLAPSTEHVLVHLAGTSRMEVTIHRSGVEKLLTAARAGNACAIPAHHTIHGERLLCLRPEERPGEPLWTDATVPFRGRMVLYLILPDENTMILFDQEQLMSLAVVLAEILVEVTPVAR
ncbi:hypothetical protein [Actinophytocola gossypii]|uniref:Uncharacterized protein n=1 Tax=Actinophytocola gossypii TaxID=2812003 RepID=A0ABT2JKC0_9PSEU|nr:hypothetical protein [Actinophytocola gossypii]MCT2587830.1 hypothetical protein [Actinophytocola gossypii]